MSRYERSPTVCRFDPQALIACAIGIAVQPPFTNTPMYAGPAPTYLGGADLSWIIGLLPTSPLYCWLASRNGACRRMHASADIARHADA